MCVCVSVCTWRGAGVLVITCGGPLISEFHLRIAGQGQVEAVWGELLLTQATTDHHTGGTQSGGEGEGGRKARG